MMTSSDGNIFRVTGPLCGEFTGQFPSQRPVTRSFHVFFDLCLNKRLSKQSRHQCFESSLVTPLDLLWYHKAAGLTHCTLGEFYKILQVLFQNDFLPGLIKLHMDGMIDRQRIGETVQEYMKLSEGPKWFVISRHWPMWLNMQYVAL